RELVRATERLRERHELELANRLRARSCAQQLFERDEPAVNLRRRALIEQLEHPRLQPVDAILALRRDSARAADQPERAASRGRDGRTDDRPERARVVLG